METNSKRVSEGWFRDDFHRDELPLTPSYIGHCVLTVGTDAKTMLKIEGAKLLPSHAYAVVGEFTKLSRV